jgi:PAS domain S-box-containing protein
MLKFYFDKRIIIGFILALAILSWLAISSYKNTTNFVSSSNMVAHTLDVLYNSQQLVATVTNIELGQRGYSLTGNPEFLGVFSQGRSKAETCLENLLQLTSDNTVQHERIKNVKQKTLELIEFSTQTIRLRQESFEAAKGANESLEGKRILEGIRDLIGELEEEENQLLSVRTEKTEAEIQKFNYAFISLLASTGFILILIFFAINLSLKKRIETEQRLKAVSDEIRDLYDNAPCGYHSLDKDGKFVTINNTLLQWLGYSREEVLEKLKFTDVIAHRDLETFKSNFSRFKETGAVYDLEFHFVCRDGSEIPVLLSAVAVKDELGNFVKSRSTTFDNTQRKRADDKIKNLNHELEAFTYSVSHDLRAPLRSIDGYSQILQEDYNDKLDDEGRRVVEVIMNNAKRMGKLIDDLLEFARLGRKDVSRTKLNMTSMVKTIANELVQEERGRKISIIIDDLHPALVDVDMIRQVWLNLLSNAIKYTGKTDVAIIEIKSVENEAEICYHVKDNGVGFDMQYLSKLFGVFQRLHKIQDFSGTGVGLAIIKRIIDHHKGKVWAEGKVNEGAIFYFTIPKT